MINIFILFSLKILACVSWRQTEGCDPNGSRQPQNDKSCNEIVPDGASGYCECQGGIRKMEKDCSKGTFDTCNDACCMIFKLFPRVILVFIIVYNIS